MFSTSLVAVPALRRVEPGDHLGADARRNRQIDERLQFGAGVAGHEDDARAGLARPGEGAANELGDAACGNANDDVLLRRPQPRDGPGAFFVVVFDAFLGAEDGFRPPAMTACTRVGSVLKVGGISADSRMPSRPLVPAPTNMMRPSLRRAVAIISMPTAMRSLLALDRREHLAILIDHQVDDVVGGELVDAKAGGVDGFGRKRLPLRSNGHTATILHSAHPGSYPCHQPRRRWSTRTSRISPRNAGWRRTPSKATRAIWRCSPSMPPAAEHRDRWH